MGKAGTVMQTRNSYDDFAWLYAEHWTDFSQQVWPVLEEWVLPSLTPGAAIIDLCCGTGNTAAHLSDRGYAVWGIDSSAAMLEYARRAAPQASFRCQDARQLTVAHEVPAVLCLFDSLNHMMCMEDLRQVFARVYLALKPGGLFFFDMNTLEKYATRWEGRTSILQDDHVAAIVTNFDMRARIATFSAAIFQQQEGQWVRRDVTLTQRAYRLNEITQALAQEHFEPVRVLEGASTAHTQHFWGRQFFLAFKPGGQGLPVR